VKIEAFRAIRADEVTRVLCTFWHGTEVVFVKKFAAVALFTEATEPMFAY